MQTRREFISGTVATALTGTIFLSPETASADEQWADKMFAKKSHDFGVVARGSDVSYRLKLKNLYKQTVHIADVRTTCGCSAGQPSQKTLLSLDEAYIEITMDTRKFMRRKDSNVIVVFDKPLRKEVTIPITAYIRTDVVVEPGSAKFGSIDMGQPAEKTLKISYAGRDDWTIKNVTTDGKLVSATVNETARGGGRVDYDIVVTLNETAPAGPLRQFITLNTNDSESDKVPILVEAQIKLDIEVKPSVVTLGTMAPGQSKKVNVVLTGKKPFAVSGVSCEKAKDVFQVSIPKKASPVQVIPLTITAPAEAGKIDEILSVSIVGRKAPVTFRAYGKIAAPGS